MNNLFTRGQEFSIVPQNFKYANKGKVVDILERCVVLELENPPIGLEKMKFNEYYSQTRNGMLYFSSAIAKIDEEKNRIVIIDRKSVV